MEKRRPHYDLDTIRATFCEASALRITRSGEINAEALGMSRTDVVTCIQSITRVQFYKSMTSHADHRVWQDVYHTSFNATELYVKFTTDFRGFLLISFKVR